MCVCVCVCVSGGGARHLQPRGGACTPPPGAQTEPASAAADAACLQSRRLAANPEFKAGQEVGKRGRGKQRGWVLRSAEVWAPTPPGGRPAPRPWPADPAPRAPGEGVMGVPPRHRCSRWAGAVQVSRHRPLSVFHSSVRHAGNKHWALLLDLLLYVCTVTDHSSVLAHPPRRHPSHPILVLQERKTGTVESGNVSEAPELASSGVQIQPLRPTKHPQTGRCTEDPPPRAILSGLTRERTTENHRHRVDTTAWEGDGQATASGQRRLRARPQTPADSHRARGQRHAPNTEIGSAKL